LAHPKKIDSEDLKLREAGFDPACTAADALKTLRDLRGNAGVSDLAVARALGGVADAGAAAMLTEMESGASGALRREIRRALFRLKARGIEIPHSAEPAAPNAGAVSPAAEELSAVLSPIDAEGARIVWIVRPRSQGGVLRMQALVFEDEGLGIVRNTGMTRRELKAEREELQARAHMKFIDADWRLADFIVCEAWRYTPEDRRAQIGDFLLMRAELIGSPPPTNFVHPMYRELEAEAAVEPSLELLKEPEISQWRLPKAAIAPFVEEIGRAGEGTIVLSPIQQQERANIVLERAIASLLSGDSGMRIRRRFEEIAYYFARVGRRTQAGWAAGAAKRLRDNADAARSLFFQAFIRAQLGTLAAAEQQKREEEPRLIMTPAEAIAAQRERERRSRRG